MHLNNEKNFVLQEKELIAWITYHSAYIETNCCEVKRKHPEKVKKLSNSIYIPAKNLLPVSASNFTFEKGNLIQPDISSLSNLHKEKHN